MFLLVPYRIDSIEQQYPFANWGVILITFAVSLAAMYGAMDESLIYSFILTGWDPASLFGHFLLHGGWIHLVGNMVFLWVFGNAICANVNQALYVGLYLFLGVFAGMTHLILDGAPALGASGAVNGIIGLAFAIYPRDEVSTFWLFLIRGGVLAIPVWVLVLIWLAFDLWGAMGDGGSVAYWAHLGGLFAGVATGLILLQLGLVKLTIYDKQNLLELFKGEKPEGPRPRY